MEIDSAEIVMVAPYLRTPGFTTLVEIANAMVHGYYAGEDWTEDVSLFILRDNDLARVHVRPVHWSGWDASDYGTYTYALFYVDSGEQVPDSDFCFRVDGRA